MIDKNSTLQDLFLIENCFKLNSSSNILIKISKLPFCKLELFHEMLTKFLDILHRVIHVAYKWFRRQKIATVP